MSTPHSPIARRYEVVQTREAIGDEIYKAIQAHRFAEVDLLSDTEQLHVSFRITDTSHEKNGDHSIVGSTEQRQTIVVHMLKASGEVFALLEG